MVIPVQSGIGSGESILNKVFRIAEVSEVSPEEPEKLWPVKPNQVLEGICFSGCSAMSQGRVIFFHSLGFDWALDSPSPAYLFDCLSMDLRRLYVFIHFLFDAFFDGID